MRRPEAWSVDLASFIAACLEKDATARASAAALQAHPFVSRGTALTNAAVLSMLRRAASARASRASSAAASGGDGTVGGGTMDLMDATGSLAGTVLADEGTGTLGGTLQQSAGTAAGNTAVPTAAVAAAAAAQGAALDGTLPAGAGAAVAAAVAAGAGGVADACAGYELTASDVYGTMPSASGADGAPPPLSAFGSGGTLGGSGGTLGGSGGTLGDDGSLRLGGHLGIGGGDLLESLYDSTLLLEGATLPSEESLAWRDGAADGGGGADGGREGGDGGGGGRGVDPMSGLLRAGDTWPDIRAGFEPVHYPTLLPGDTEASAAVGMLAAGGTLPVGGTLVAGGTPVASGTTAGGDTLVAGQSTLLASDAQAMGGGGGTVEGVGAERGGSSVREGIAAMRQQQQQQQQQRNQEDEQHETRMEDAAPPPRPGCCSSASAAASFAAACAATPQRASTSLQGAEATPSPDLSCKEPSPALSSPMLSPDLPARAVTGSSVTPSATGGSAVDVADAGDDDVDYAAVDALAANLAVVSLTANENYFPPPSQAPAADVGGGLQPADISGSAAAGAAAGGSAAAGSVASPPLEVGLLVRLASAEVKAVETAAAPPAYVPPHRRQASRGQLPPPMQKSSVSSSRSVGDGGVGDGGSWRRDEGGGAAGQARHTGRGFEQLCALAHASSRNDAYLKEHALPVYLNGLSSPDAAMQQAALNALLAIILRAPPTAPSAQAAAADGGSAGTAKVLNEVLETVLSQAFLPNTGQSLKLLTTLALQPHSASRLALPAKFDSLLTIIHLKAFGEPHKDYAAAAQALHVVHAIMLHAANGISLEQAEKVVDLTNRLVALDGLAEGAAAREAAIEAAKHTAQQARDMHPDAAFPTAVSHESDDRSEPESPLIKSLSRGIRRLSGQGP